MNSYDTWKQATPPEYEYEKGNRCWFCNDPVPDGEKFCNNNCRKGYKQDN